MDKTNQDVRIIKRYANRKMYDSQESRYVKLQDIAEMVREGIDVQIIDNKTKEDITARTLAQMFSEQERRQEQSVPLSTLKQLIRSGGDILSRKVTQPVSSLREEAEKTVATTVATLRDDMEKGVHRLRAKEKESSDFLKQSAREWVENAQVRLDDAQRKFDDRTADVMAALPLLKNLQLELAELRARVQTLEEAQGIFREED